MATQKITLGKGSKLWWGRKAIKVSEYPTSGWGRSNDGLGLHAIQIEGENGGRLLEMTKEDARALCFILFDLTEDSKDEAKPAES